MTGHKAMRGISKNNLSLLETASQHSHQSLHFTSVPGVTDLGPSFIKALRESGGETRDGKKCRLGGCVAQRVLLSLSPSLLSTTMAAKSLLFLISFNFFCLVCALLLSGGEGRRGRKKNVWTQRTRREGEEDYRSCLFLSLPPSLWIKPRRGRGGDHCQEVFKKRERKRKGKKRKGRLTQCLK